jgi:hypothetical protein
LRSLSRHVALERPEATVRESAHAVALTAHARAVEVACADGRSGKNVAELVLSGIEQIE